MACLCGFTTQQIGDEDVEFRGRSFSVVRFNRLFIISGRGTLATMETILSVLNRWKSRESRTLHLAGMAVQDIYEDLPDPGPINAEEDNAFKVCLSQLDGHF